MKRRVNLIILTAAACLAGATVYQGLTASVDSGGLVVYWTESGVPKTESPFSYSVHAKTVTSYGCFTKSGKNPAAGSKRVTFTTESMQKLMVQSVTGGTVRGKARLGIPSVQDRLNCPPGLTARLSSVSYSGILIQNHTLGTSVRVPGTYQKTFLPLK